MKKSTKGALAAAAAGTLLLGGAGSLAFWNDATTVTGTTINSGHLKLINSSCGGNGWILDEGAGPPHEAPFTNQLLVPGDKLTKTCTFEVDAAGAHLQATFGTSDTILSSSDPGPGWLPELQVGATYAVNAGTPGNGQTPVAVVDGDVVTAKLSITFPYGTLNNDSNQIGGLSATLDNITVTATQVNNH